MTVQVPAIYQQYVTQAAQATGLPVNVVAAQIQYESSFNPNAVSPAGAQGIAQFLPSTFATYGHGSPFNVADAFAAYANYMKALLQQEGGDVTKALEAYNAGPGNLSAGAGYAQHILSVAGQPGGIQLGGAQFASSGGSDTASWLSKLWGWATHDPVSKLLGVDGLAGTLASGLEQGLMRGFLDILLQVWNKVAKPLFWVVEIIGGIIVMLVALNILIQKSPVGQRLDGMLGMLPGPAGSVARGASAVMGGRVTAGASLLRGARSESPAAQERREIEADEAFRAREEEKYTRARARANLRRQFKREDEQEAAERTSL